jgi:prepilin peptidase CpaA
MGGMGAGNAKLMGAIGAMLGPRAIANICLFTALAGGIYALGVIILRRESKNVIRDGLTSLWVLAATQEFSLHSAPQGDGMPRLYYAVAILAGSVLYTIFVLAGQDPII